MVHIRAQKLLARSHMLCFAYHDGGFLHQITQRDLSMWTVDLRFVEAGASQLLLPGNCLAQYKIVNPSDMIQRRPRAHLFKLLQGYLAGYLAMLTDQRPVVFINLQKAKLDQPEVDNQNRAVVDHHKTDRAFGNAFMALLPWEVDWLKGLMEVSALVLEVRILRSRGPEEMGPAYAVESGQSTPFV
ncbi:hypothetical protein SRHO_G00030900 [Serrasalmus rhombeus]